MSVRTAAASRGGRRGDACEDARVNAGRADGGGRGRAAALCGGCASDGGEDDGVFEEHDEGDEGEQRGAAADVGRLECSPLYRHRQQ